MAGNAQNSHGAGSAFIPADSEERRIITQELDRTLFVEASAGTGKTTGLVQRIVNLALIGKTTLDRIAAITFTELAAAELRDRVRQELERAATSPSIPEEQRRAAAKGVSDLDQANIRTLHSFAGQLLHERPLEAGLPPGFDTSDEIAAGLAFDQEWEEWLDRALSPDAPFTNELALLLTQGITLEHLKGLAREFHENYADLNYAALKGFAQAEVTPAAGSAGMALEQRWPEAERLQQLSQIGAGDALYDHVSVRGVTVRALQDTTPGDLDYHRQLARLLNLRTNRGRQSDWNADPTTGDNGCKVLKDLLAELHQVVAAELEEAKRHALGVLAVELERFALNYAQRRKREGRAEFHDLLVWARDLLRDDLAVRDHFRRRFSHLLIDESQDTDPIQAEIAMFLAESTTDNMAANGRPNAWEDIVPETGKLFVVGDAKQSIYRFRRADVEQMVRLQHRLQAGGGSAVNLVQNFRSHEPLVNWVNHLFARWMDGETDGGQPAPGQANYVPMAHRWMVEADSPVGPRVWALANEEQSGNIGAVRQQEAADIASLLSQVVEEGWLKLDQTATEAAGGTAVYSPVRFSDICILIRARTSLPELERALDAANIPYHLESASLVFESQEVRDLLNCLRAIDNPADRMAIVAALRSPAFGCSDIDLLRHHEAGGQFDYLTDTGVGGDPVVIESLETLKQFHLRRMWERPATLIERFVRDRMLLEAATQHTRMREQWRRYRFMVDRAAQYAESGGKSLRSFLGWIEDQMVGRVRVTEAPAPETDEESVRVMTMHSAKGLEFPVAILTGLNSTPRNPAPASLYDRQTGQVEVSLGSGNNRIATEGYQDLADRERQMAEAENVRLLYVAATRARDHLVLSLRRGERGTTQAHAMAEFMEDRPELWEPITLRGSAPPPGWEEEEEGRTPAIAAGPDQSVAARDAWQSRRQQLIAGAGKPQFTSATALGLLEREERERKDEQENEQDVEPWRRGRAGTQVGRAVHAVLQSIDLATGEGLEERARGQAAAEGIPLRENQVARLARVAVESDIVRRAVQSGRLWREVPVAASVAGGFLHGFIDLLFEEPEGFVIVDYKTDSVSQQEAGQAVEKYRLQGGAYAYAISKATGKPVKEVRFLYLQPRQDVVLPDLAGAMADAEALARVELAPGR